MVLGHRWVWNGRVHTQQRRSSPPPRHRTNVLPPLYPGPRPNPHSSPPYRSLLAEEAEGFLWELSRKTTDTYLKETVDEALLHISKEPFLVFSGG